MKKSREQAIYDELYSKCQKLCKTYVIKPPLDTPYPFIEFEDTDVEFKANKTDIIGSVTLNLSVYDVFKNRIVVSNIANEIFGIALEIRESNGYFYSLDIRNSNISMIDDDSTVDVLKRAIIKLKFNLL